MNSYTCLQQQRLDDVTVCDLPKRIVYVGFGFASSILMITFFCSRCFHFYSAIDTFLFILNDQNLSMRASQTEKYQNNEN